MKKQDSGENATEVDKKYAETILKCLKQEQLPHKKITDEGVIKFRKDVLHIDKEK